tara:strand:+ start:77 stop:241 length:165 start_codon:yes stop_codon:yes gene_type:complete
MTDHERKTIDNSIQAYKRMVKFFQKQISILENKKAEKCCFDKETKQRLKIKRAK